MRRRRGGPPRPNVRWYRGQFGSATLSDRLLCLQQLVRWEAARGFSRLISLAFSRDFRRCPELFLKKCGIAPLSPASSTLGRIIRSIGAFRGEIAECGVYRGWSLLGMAHLARKLGAGVRVYGLDGFEGLPAPTEHDRRTDGSFYEGAQEGMFGDASYEELLSKIAWWGLSDRVVVLKGPFRETLPDLADREFHLVHIDADLYESYKESLEFFYPRVVPGGYMVLDEYGHEETFPGASRAVDEFLRGKPEKLCCYEDLNEDSRRYFIMKQELS